MTALPRPDIKASKPTTAEGEPASEHAIDVVISRDGKAQSYRGDGSTREESVEKVIRQIIDNPKTIEFLP